MNQNQQKIIDNFQQLIESEKSLDSKIATKEQEAQQQKGKEILQTALTYTVDNIVKGLADLQLEINETINQIAIKLTNETNKLEEINRSLDLSKQELNHLQKIRLAADALYILQQEHQEQKKALQQKYEKLTTSLEQEINQTRKHWEKEQTDHQAYIQDETEKINREREKEQEIYQYNLTQNRKIEQDQYQQQNRQQTRSLELINQEKQKDWTQREQTISANQTQLTEYKQKIATIPAELEAAIKKAREEAIKETLDDAKVKANLLEKEWEGQKQGYELKIQSLETTIAKQLEQINELTTQLQTILKQSQDLAMRAFSANTPS